MMALVTPMKSMELDEEESYDSVMPIPMPDKPSFPYGLRICLTDAEFKKLGIDPTEAMQGIGGLVHLHGLARITSASMDQRDGGEACCRVELQIEDLAIESEEAENAEVDAAAPSKISRLYKTAAA